jgi:lipopolysaccharide/colanic/teichoic acid biosynthesis glycosyltransferase
MAYTRSVLATESHDVDADFSIPQRRASDVLRLPDAAGELGVYPRFVKPVIDWIVAFLLFAIVLPVLVAVAVAVYAEYGRPILFRQSRVGRDGREFKVNKFRTMDFDRRGPAEGPFSGRNRRLIHKSEDDPRIRAVGRFLRVWSLDELPQLANVLTGDMSLVGPRPEMVQIVERYEEWQHARHRVKPGITGLWQVSAREIPMHQATHIDLEYINRLSLLEDLRIMAGTLPAALGDRKGF